MKKPVIGWRESIRLVDLYDQPIKCKVDTGAASSSIYAQVLEIYEQALANGVHQSIARFLFFPNTHSAEGIECCLPLLEYRKVRSSNGHLSRRPVVITTAQLLDIQWPIEITLADRRRMDFPMLLGREAIGNRFLVDVDRSFVGRRKSKSVPPPPAEDR